MAGVGEVATDRPEGVPRRVADRHTRRMSDRTDAAETRETHDRLNLFERFVEVSTGVVSRAPFFAVCVAVVVVWALSYPLWKTTTKWELAIHTFTAVLSLLLLVLLENSGRRHTEAMQEKLNVLAEGLSALMESQAADDPELAEAVEKLREAVGLEGRH